jgi:CheY-like chemotaxis protein
MNTTLMLEDLGHQVVEAFNGAQALEVLEKGERFDLVLTDHSMPKMTGAELAGSIHERWPSLPVVLATGYAELPSGEGGKLPKLSKPFSPEPSRWPRYSPWRCRGAEQNGIAMR